MSNCGLLYGIEYVGQLEASVILRIGLGYKKKLFFGKKKAKSRMSWFPEAYTNIVCFFFLLRELLRSNFL